MAWPKGKKRGVAAAQATAQRLAETERALSGTEIASVVRALNRIADGIARLCDEVEAARHGTAPARQRAGRKPRHVDQVASDLAETVAAQGSSAADDGLSTLLREFRVALGTPLLTGLLDQFGLKRIEDATPTQREEIKIAAGEQLRGARSMGLI